MSDLIELLRAAARHNCGFAPSSIPSTLEWKAAAELERLTAELGQAQVATANAMRLVEEMGVMNAELTAENAALLTHQESFRVVLAGRDGTIKRLQKSHTDAWNFSVRDQNAAAESAKEAEKYRARVAELTAENAALRADAERYAFCKTLEGQVEFITAIRNKGAAHLDAAIDSARARESGDG